MPDLTTAKLQRLTDARWQGEQALFTTAVAMLTERPALPGDLAGLAARLREVSDDARNEFAERFFDAEYSGERPDLEPITAELTVERIEEAADAIEALLDELGAKSTCEAVSAAREPQCAVVKPLVWFEAELPSRGGGKYTANGYTLRRIEGLWLLDFAGDGKTAWRWVDLEDAKAAAQADYEARILSAITLRPEAEVSAEAWVAATAQISDVRGWLHYPIVMPLKDGRGPASDAECDTITWEVWDKLLNTHASFDNLPDAINAAMRLNNAMLTDDASAALDRIKADAKTKGMRKAADICIGETLIVAPEGIGQYAALDSYRAQIRSAIISAIPEVRK